MHCVGVGVWLGDYGVGVTRGMVDGFLMANGQPIDVIQGWIDQLPSVISLSSPQSFLASSLITVTAPKIRSFILDIASHSFIKQTTVSNIDDIYDDTIDIK